MSTPRSPLIRRLLPGPRSAPATTRDLTALAGYTAFAAILLSPLRHYVGSQKQVQRQKVEHDSFPLSTYPMFSADRKGRVTVPHVVGITDDGVRVPLHYRHFGTGGLNQVRKQISRGVRRGHAADIAQRYADSIAASTRRRDANIVKVLVVRSRFQFDDYFDATNPSTTPDRETVHAQCVIGGTAELLEEKTA